MWEYQGSRIAKTILKNKTGRLTLPTIKIDGKATVIKSE